jgi:hypothetical protein
MRIGAKIMLSTGLDAASGGLASLAGSSWMMSLSQQQGAYHCGHPAGRGRPGLSGPGGGAGLVAVTFGAPLAVPGSPGSLPVQWESVELGDAFAVLLAGDVTVAAAASQGHSTLALAGFCRLLPAADGGNKQDRVDLLKEVARSFITSVADAVASYADPSHLPQPPGPASSWVNGRA